MITLFEILNHAYPDRGGWNVDGDIITAGDGGSVPTPEEIEAHRAATEQAKAEAAAIAAARKIWADASEFLGEFSMPELAAISLSTDPTIAALRLLLASWPGEVWSNDPRIVAGLAALVSAGIINSTRSAEIVAKT